MNKDSMNHIIDDLDPEEAHVAEKLQVMARQINPNPVFESQLQTKLKENFRPHVSYQLPILKQLASTVGFVALLMGLAFFMNWTFRRFVPNEQPAFAITATAMTVAPTETPVRTSLVEGQATPAWREYVVTAGDTCESIAKHFGISMESLLALNNLAPDCSILTVAETIKIPPASVLAPESQGYTWRGMPLYISATLPSLSPTEANLYLLENDQRASLDEVYALADRFGIQGEAAEIPGDLPGITNYVISDGKQRLNIYSVQDFTYYADYEKFVAGTRPTAVSIDAQTVIDRFLKKVGYDFPYQFERADAFGGYYVLPLMPDGYALRYNFMLPERLEFLLDDSGQVFLMQASLAHYKLVGLYGIRTADEALAIIVNATTSDGLIEHIRGKGGGGGGGGFYKLNLSGTPVPFPTPLPTLAPNDGGVVTLPPTATIEQIELVYFVNDPRYETRTAESQYIQPAWRFYGHYSTGDEFEILVQALKVEYLLPEVVPAPSGG